jgi:hypothetical protein
MHEGANQNGFHISVFGAQSHHADPGIAMDTVSLNRKTLQRLP